MAKKNEAAEEAERAVITAIEASLKRVRRDIFQNTFAIKKAASEQARLKKERLFWTQLLRTVRKGQSK